VARGADRAVIPLPLMLPDSAVDAFLARLDEETRSRLGPRAATELERVWAEARAAWPAVPLDAERFCGFLAPRVAGADLSSLRAADLYLACACAADVPEAMQAFESILTEVGVMLRNIARSDDVLEEAKQITRQVLLQRGERPPPIADYTGRGDLRGWLRVALGRELVRLLRRGQDARRLATGELARIVDENDDPETAYLKRHYQDEFKDAFAGAVERLDGTDRRLLRFAVIERLSIDDIARLERVHRSTAARQVLRARERLVEETRRLLRARLRVDAEQLHSILRLIESQVDVSVQRLLVG
jgi:RNA polymerase sigma-70 factor (ECF subfamily)